MHKPEANQISTLVLSVVSCLPELLPKISMQTIQQTEHLKLI